MASQSEISSSSESTNSKPDEVCEEIFAMGETQKTVKTSTPSVEDANSAEQPLSFSAELFSEAFLKQFEPDCKKMENKINNVNQSQSVLIESLHHETERLKNSDVVGEIEAAMKLVQSYRFKLLRIKKNMASLKDTSQRLKRDVGKLQLQKQKEDLKKEELKRKALTEEKNLTAEFSPDSV